MQLMQEGMIFVVRRVDMILHGPARLDDNVKIKTELAKLGKVSFDFKQKAFVNSQLITEASIKCGSLDSKSFKPSALPEYLHSGMKKLLL